jgi:hypothetical protein
MNPTEKKEFQALLVVLANRINELEGLLPNKTKQMKSTDRKVFETLLKDAEKIDFDR